MGAPGSDWADRLEHWGCILALVLMALIFTAAAKCGNEYVEINGQLYVIEYEESYEGRQVAEVLKPVSAVSTPSDFWVWVESKTYWLIGVYCLVVFVVPWLAKRLA